MEILIVILMFIVLFLTFDDLKLRRELKDFSKFIDDIEGGNFDFSGFDEKEISKLKSKVLKFLRANAVRENRINDEKEKTNKLISDISHQTKTPIANLVLYNNLMKKENKLEYMEIMDEELRKLEFLIESLVKSSRLESNIINLCKREENFADLVAEVIDELKAFTDEKNLKINFYFEELRLNVDKRWMKEAIHNLIENAIKYTPENSEIDIKIYKSYLNYNLDIENYCDKLNEDDSAKIFGRFYRGKNSIGKDGLGLGLFITREIIEKQGGTIKSILDSNKIKFEVDFPL